MKSEVIESNQADRGATIRREARRFLKFLVVGGIGFLIDTGSLTVLALGLHTDRTLAKGISFSLAVISNYLLNRFWTYPDSRSKSVLAQITQFVVVSLVGLGINLLVFNWADRVAMRWVSSVLALYVAQVCAVGVALFWNFAANRVVTYNDVGIGR
jgi:putative flippase GtrA